MTDRRGFLGAAAAMALIPVPQGEAVPVGLGSVTGHRDHIRVTLGRNCHRGDVIRSHKGDFLGLAAHDAKAGDLVSVQVYGVWVK